jgi:hypothetical protein
MSSMEACYPRPPVFLSSQDCGIRDVFDIRIV